MTYVGWQLDWIVVAVVALSVLLGMARGITRELIALITWVAGLLAALALAPMLGGLLPELGGNPAMRYLIAFAFVLIGALILGGLVAWPLAGLIRKTGLGFVDRFLGAVFGVIRGAFIVLAMVLFAGLTTLPRQDWWQNAALVPPLVVAALALRPWLPEEWAQRLDYSRDGRTDSRVPAPAKV